MSIPPILRSNSKLSGDIRRPEPMYQQLADSLRQAVISGQFANGKLPTERQLGKQYGVSVSVVKNAVNQLEKENLIWRAPRRGTFIVGSGPDLLPPRKPVIYLAIGQHRWAGGWSGSSFYFSVTEEIRQLAESAGMDLVSRPIQSEMDTPAADLPNHQILQGVLTFQHAHAKEFRKALPRETPVVSLDHCINLAGDSRRATGVQYIACDNISGGQEATRYLLKKGHRKIVFVGGEIKNFPTAKDRFAGYCKAMKKAGHKPVFLTEDTDWIQQAKRGTTSLIAYNDHTAIRIMSRIYQQGFSLPDDFSILCFDDLLPVLAETAPAITALAMPYKKMVKLAFDALNEPGKSGKQLVNYQLIERESVLTIPLKNKGRKT